MKNILLLLLCCLLSGLPLHAEFKGACSILNDIDTGGGIDYQALNSGSSVFIPTVSVRHDIVPTVKPQLTINFRNDASVLYPDDWLQLRSGMTADILLFLLHQNLLYLYPGVGVAVHSGFKRHTYTIANKEYYRIESFSSNFISFNTGAGIDVPIYKPFYLNGDIHYTYFFNKFNALPNYNERKNYLGIRVSLFINW